MENKNEKYYLKKLLDKSMTLNEIKVELENNLLLYEEILENLKESIIDLSINPILIKDVEKKTGLSSYEILGLIMLLKEDNIYISTRMYDKGISLTFHGELLPENIDQTVFNTDNNNELKLTIISDLRLGSTKEQLSILNDIYDKAVEQGHNKVIICGNITEGLYPKTDLDLDEKVLYNDSIMQIEHAIKEIPKRKGITTYIITGKKDSIHAKKNKINVGKRISDARDDIVYLGNFTSKIKIDNTDMLLFTTKLAKPYTTSYRPQQLIDAFRSEDKPDILIFGGLMQSEKFKYRDVLNISVPSVVGTTKEMEEKRYANTIGAWYVTIKTNEKGLLDKVDAKNSIYYKTSSNSTPKFVSSAHTDDQKDIYNKNFVSKLIRTIKNDMKLEELMSILGCSYEEVMGMIQLCSIYGHDIRLIMNEKKELIIRKYNARVKPANLSKLSENQLNYNQILVVSDTHIGNNQQQLHLLNQLYQEAHDRGIDTVLHVGDLVDGDYLNIRPEQARLTFLHGFDKIAGYVVDNYPEINGITTKFILGSHDETLYKNGQATLDCWISRSRKDMIYLGQDVGTTTIDKVSIMLDHPGGGSSRALSYQPQRRIEELESGHKPKILLIGHFHKSYFFVYRNVYGIEVPALCAKTQFQQKKGLQNIVGGYFLHIYSDKYGNIQYLEPEEILFDQKDFWEEAGKDKKKVKQLVIN